MNGGGGGIPPIIGGAFIIGIGTLGIPSYKKGGPFI